MFRVFSVLERREIAMLERNPDARCETCPYCIQEEEGSSRYSCHRRSPMPLDFTFDPDYSFRNGTDARYIFQIKYIAWPDVDIDGTCGEHPEFLRETPDGQ